ncbi:MAG: hypothetical protein MESAZ_02759 [Saezia sanguinis]
MPNRILREGILTSERVNSLNWQEEVFYRRLMSVVDDHGRFHALPKLLRAACYPLHIDKVSDADIGKWITACVTAGLVSVYPAADGKRYIQILNFGQQVRAKSKFPNPIDFSGEQLKSSDINCNQLPANEHLGVFGDGDEGEDDIYNSPSGPKAKKKSRIPKNLEPTKEMVQFAIDRGFDHQNEFEAFKNYHIANATLSADWSANWRTWVLRGVKYAEEKKKPKAPLSKPKAIAEKDFTAGVNEDGTLTF